MTGSFVKITKPKNFRTANNTNFKKTTGTHPNNDILSTIKAIIQNETKISV